jgi:hypothetical protein
MSGVSREQALFREINERVEAQVVDSVFEVSAAP